MFRGGQRKWGSWRNKSNGQWDKKKKKKVEKCFCVLVTCKLHVPVKMQYKYNWQSIFLPAGKLIANIITFCAVFYCRTGCCLLLFTSLSFYILDFGPHVHLDMSPYKLSPCLSFLDNSTLWLKTSLLSYCDRLTSKMAPKSSPKHWVIPLNNFFLYIWAGSSELILWQEEDHDKPNQNRAMVRDIKQMGCHFQDF